MLYFKCTKCTIKYQLGEAEHDVITVSRQRQRSVVLIFNDFIIWNVSVHVNLYYGMHFECPRHVKYSRMWSGSLKSTCILATPVYILI